MTGGAWLCPSVVEGGSFRAEPVPRFRSLGTSTAPSTGNGTDMRTRRFNKGIVLLCGLATALLPLVRVARRTGDHRYLPRQRAFRFRESEPPEVGIGRDRSGGPDPHRRRR